MSKIMPFLSLLFAAFIVAFGLGVAVTEFKLPPYREISHGAKTLLYMYKGLGAPPYLGQFTQPQQNTPAGDAPARRFEATAATADVPGNILVIGGLNEYRDICPEQGCIAVEYDRDGTIVHGIPYRPAEIQAADSTGGSFYREAKPGDPALVSRPIGMAPLPDGDVVVSFQSTGVMFPYAGGIARLDRDGHPRWYRLDYSHHWVTYANDRIYVPDLTIPEGDFKVEVGPTKRDLTAFCESGRPMIDGIQVLDLDGNVVDRLDVEAMLRATPYEALLVNPFEPCDPLHLNYVDVLDETAPGGDLKPGNLLVSSRNLSALFVIDPEAREIVRVVHGTFQQQHSAHHLSGSKALLFDNWGASGAGNGSRLLEVDLAGGPERQVFPDPEGTPRPDLYSARAGHLDIAPDRRHAFVSFTETGTSIEVDIETREALTVIRSLHDLRDVEGASDAQKTYAVWAKLFGTYYLEP